MSSTRFLDSRDPWAPWVDWMEDQPIWKDFDGWRVDVIPSDDLLVKHAQAGVLYGHRPYTARDAPFLACTLGLALAVEQTAERKAAALRPDRADAALEAEQRRAERSSHLPEDLRDYMNRMLYEGLTGDFADQVWPRAVASRVKVFGNTNSTYQAICGWRSGARVDRKGDIERLVRFGMTVYQPPARSLLRPGGAVWRPGGSPRIAIFPHPHFDDPGSAGVGWGN